LTFSVIIPTHNRAAQLANCLCALARLDYPRDRFEVIVVDDASETPLDDALARVPPELQVTLIRQAQAGPAAARNAGARCARGELLAFTDDDCAPAPDWLAAFEARLHAAPKAALGGRTINALSANPYSIASQMLISYLYAYYNADPDRAHFFASNNFAVAREPFLAIGGFDASFPRAAEDRDFCDRWIFQGRALTYVPDAVVYHAHLLTFGSFLRQHWYYGRSAYHFHELRAQRHHARLRMEPPPFYFDLVRYPYRKLRLPRAAQVAGLMVLTQVANVAGFAYERMRP
jgi:GT2 family glycosyltransferase